MDDAGAQENHAQDSNVDTKESKLIMESSSTIIDRALQGHRMQEYLNIYYPGHKSTGSCRYENSKLILSVDGGIVIIPDDLSYRRFISNTWYD